jgi:hypothetical protein
MTRWRRIERFQLAGMLVIAGLVATGFWMADGAESGLLAGAWMLAFVGAVHFGRRRSDAISVVGGIGDERTRNLYTRSLAFAGAVLSFVIPGWWLITVVQGRPSQTLALLGAIFAVSFVGAAFVVSRRG